MLDTHLKRMCIYLFGAAFFTYLMITLFLFIIDRAMLKYLPFIVDLVIIVALTTF